MFRKLETKEIEDLRLKFIGKQEIKSNRSLEELEPLIKEQSDKVRQLKAQKADKQTIDKEVKTLLDLKQELSAVSGDSQPNNVSKKSKKKQK